MRRRPEVILELPPGLHLSVPVLAATGGQTRSTVSGLLAGALAAYQGAHPVVFDTVPRALSPWPSWVVEKGGGLESIPPDRPFSTAQALEALSGCGSPEARWQVLTDHQEWSARPLQLPDEPAAWSGLASIGGWRAAVFDTGYSVIEDMAVRRRSGEPTLTERWFTASEHPAPVVLATDGSARGLETARAAIALMDGAGLPLSRVLLVVSARAGVSEPRPVSAGLTMLGTSLAGVIRLPYDPTVHAFGLRQYGRMGNRLLQASRHLCQVVARTAAEAASTRINAVISASDLQQNGEL